RSEPLLAVAEPAAEISAECDRTVMIDAVDRMVAAGLVADIALLVRAVFLAVARRDAALEFLDGRLGREDVERLGRMRNPATGSCLAAAGRRVTGDCRRLAAAGYRFAADRRGLAAACRRFATDFRRRGDACH